MSKLTRSFAAPMAAALLLSFSHTASADTLVIKRPGAHPDYVFEAEPHLLLGFVDPPGPAHGNGVGAASWHFEIVDNGFVSSINNSVGVGVGLDWVRYGKGGRNCRNPGPGPNHCAFFDDDNEIDYFYIPLVLQWNFWLSRNWSVFGEPGVALRFFEDERDDDGIRFDPLVIYGGGRWHFSDYAALTMRIGYPTFSVGVSFLL